MEVIIYNYMISKLELSTDMGSYNFCDNFINADASLNFDKILVDLDRLGLDKGYLIIYDTRRNTRKSGSRIVLPLAGRKSIWFGYRYLPRSWYSGAQAGGQNIAAV